MTWPWNGSEEGGDLALIQTSLLLLCKLGAFARQMQRGLYQSNVTSSLASMLRPGHQADNCKMIYSTFTFRTWNVNDPQKICITSMIISPNCYAVKIFECSSTNVAFLPSCLSVLSECVVSQSKSLHSVDLDLLKLAKNWKSEWLALFRGNVCI